MTSEYSQIPPSAVFVSLAISIIMLALAFNVPQIVILAYHQPIVSAVKLTTISHQIICAIILAP